MAVAVATVVAAVVAVAVADDSVIYDAAVVATVVALCDTNYHH